jgi:predicted Zn finger-like uncharacterized protein
MSDITACPGCGRKLRVPDGLAGRKVKCPGCGTIFNPAVGADRPPESGDDQPGRHETAAATTDRATGEITLCPGCGRKLRVPESLTGRQVKCPDCATVFTSGGVVEDDGYGPRLTTAIACPGCRSQVKVATDSLGRSVMCPHCKDVFTARVGDDPGPRREQGPARGTRVFISHSTRDRAFVEREIVRFLDEHGVATWYAEQDIHTASQWERAILQGLESCDWLIVVMSPRSAASEWVKDEVHWAIEHRPQRIIPVLIEDCNTRDFHIRMPRIQYVDFRDDLSAARARLLSLFRD